MRNNSSKQILLSVIGITVLVVAILGVSFAFFNFSKFANDNRVSNGNVVTTFFNSSNEVFIGNNGNLNGDIYQNDLDFNIDNLSNYSKFDIKAKVDSNKINFKVYAIPSYDTANTNRFSDEEVYLYLGRIDNQSSDVVEFNGNADYYLNSHNMNNYNTEIEVDGFKTSAILLGSGTFKQSGTITLAANTWIQTDKAITNEYGATTILDPTVKNMYYMMKYIVVID